MKRTIDKKPHINVESKKGERDNADSVLEYCERNGSEQKDSPGPHHPQEETAEENARDEQRKTRANAAALFCNFDSETSEVEDKTLPADRYPYQPKKKRMRPRLTIAARKR